jgi:hypothetical protein
MNTLADKVVNQPLKKDIDETFNLFLKTLAFAKKAVQSMNDKDFNNEAFGKKLED